MAVTAVKKAVKVCHSGSDRPVTHVANMIG